MYNKQYSTLTTNKYKHTVAKREFFFGFYHKAIQNLVNSVHENIFPTAQKYTVYMKMAKGLCRILQIGNFLLVKYFTS